MKKKIISFMSILVITQSSNAVTVKNINFKNANLSDVIQSIASIDKKSIMFGPKFKNQKVNIDINHPISAGTLFFDILKEYCLSYKLVNGVYVINSSNCQPTIIHSSSSLPPLPPLSSLLSSNQPQDFQNIAVAIPKEIIQLKGIKSDSVTAWIKSIKGINNVQNFSKLNTLVISGTTQALKTVNSKLKYYFKYPPKTNISFISTPLYIYNISLPDLKKLIAPYISKKAIIIDKTPNQIILEDYPENIENILDYFSQYVSLKPKYITKVLFIRNNLDKAYNIAKTCKLKSINKSKEFKAIILTGLPSDVLACKPLLSPYLSKTPRENVITSTTFYIKYISLDKFKNLIQPYLSNKAILTPVKNINAIVVRDYIQNLENIKKHFKEYISTKPLYIQIKVSAIEINKNYQKVLGLGMGGAYEGRGITTFNTNNFATSVANAFNFISQGGTPIVESNPISVPNGLISGLYSEGKFHILGFEINALESINKAKSVFQSTLLSMNNQPTTLTQGLEYPFTTIEPGQTVPTVNLQNILNSIKVTPVLLPQNKILLNIKIQNMSLGSLAANGQPTVNQNSNSLTIVVSSGETLAIGGIKLKNHSKSIQAIPGLYKVPVVGNVGMNQNKQRSNSNLFIFITAKRVDK